MNVNEMVARLRSVTSVAWNICREAADMLVEMQEENARLREEIEALRQFYNGVGDCIYDRWECERCGNSEPWWTDTNADYATREARVVIAALEPRK
jgi:phage-related minor tail protein